MSSDVVVGRSTGVETGLTRVRAVFDRSEDVGIVEMSNNLYDLSSLMWVSYALARETNQDATHRTFQADDVRMALDDTRVDRISYNSPLEVWLTVSAVLGSATFVGQRLLALHDSFQHSRRVASDTQVIMAGNQVVLDQLKAWHANLGDLPLDVLEGAASALNSVKTLEVHEEPT